MRPEIGRERVGDAIQVLSPGYESWRVVDAYTQDLGVEPLEPGELRLIRGNLAGSNGGPGERVEHDNNVFASLGSKIELVSKMCRERKFGGPLPWRRCRHCRFLSKSGHAAPMVSPQTSAGQWLRSEKLVKWAHSYQCFMQRQL